MKFVENKTLETERLILRKFRIEDAENMFNNWASDPETAKFLSWNTHKSVEETRNVIESWIADYGVNYNWVVELKENGNIIGNISSVHIHKNDNVIEVGYCYGSKFWNKGYASEALRRVIQFFLTECDADVVEAYHISGNPASGRVMQKAGMKYDCNLRNRRINKHTGNREDLIAYSITKNEF